MRIVRQQMLCIISPHWPGDPAALRAGRLHKRLRALLREVDIVHFASLALLPPAEGSACPLPSLMLEIVVDEGTAPEVVLNRLAHHPSGTLWLLYGACFESNAPPSGKRNDELRDMLLAQVNIAGGGFVGPRDRYIAQIRKERILYHRVRQIAPGIEAERRNERSTFASSLARRVLRRRSFEWVNERSPKSFWRARSGIAKGIYFSLLAVLAYVALWAVVGASNLLRTSGIGAVAGWAIDAMSRGAKALLLAALLLMAYRVLFWLLGAAARGWHAWFERLMRELNRPNDAWSARVAHVFGWLTVLPTALLALATLTYIAFDCKPTDMVAWYRSRVGSWPHMAAQAYAALYLPLLAVLLFGLRSSRASVDAAGDGWLARKRKAVQRWFFRPIDGPVAGAQQVHPMIELCEARLVARTAHMISLTDLRRPYAWSAFWTRASLWVVTTIGYFLFTEGKLGDAPGIQFSHWHIVDGGRRLLFCANFDGTFGGYLDDFIKGPSSGTTLFWRWTELRPRQAAVPGHPDVSRLRRFPSTRLLVCRGVRCEQQFKTYARESMLPHLFRFVAQDLSLEEKNRGTRLRDALGGERTDPKDDLIMRSLEA